MRPNRVTTNLHVIRQRRKHPDPSAAVKAPGGLELQLATEQLVDELERLNVLHDPIPLSDDPEHRPRVLAHSRVPARDLLAPRLPPVVDRSGLTPVDRDPLALDPPTERPDAIIASAVVAGGLSSTQPSPCHGTSRTENIESLLVIPAGMSHFPSVVTPLGAGPVEARAARPDGVRNWPRPPAPTPSQTSNS